MEEKDFLEKDEIFSKVQRAGRRTYFFDVRATKSDDYYITITESKKFTEEDGSFHFKKHKIYLYKEDFAEFKEILDDPNVTDKKAIKTLVFCTGKVYYDIIAKREELERNDVAVIRLEQLFPLATDQIQAIIDSYPNVDDYVWAQEEPKNMGAYGFMLMNFNLVKFRLASPKAYSAPAAGSYERSKKRQANAIAMVFDKNLFQ